MSGTVGGIAAQLVKPNAPTGNKQRIVTWIVPGLTGIGAHKLGENEADWEFILIFFGTDAACDAWAISIEALQSTIITIIDDHGDTYTDMLVVSMANPRKIAAFHAAGNGVLDRRCEITIAGKVTS